MNEYIKSITAFHLARLRSGLGPELAGHAKLCLLDSVGCMLASRRDCEKELAFIAEMSPWRPGCRCGP